MSEHKLAEYIDGFHLESYYSGVIMAFSEVVGAGCKKLALSNPFNDKMAHKMLLITELAAEEYGVKTLLEPDLVDTKLFPSGIAKDKTVIIIAQNQDVLNEYMELRKMKKNSDLAGNPEDLEKLIAKRFGQLLSYSDKKIDQLMKVKY